MPMTISLTSTTASATVTNIVIATAGRTGGYDRVDVQYSTRKDFQFALAPIAPFVAAASITLENLNQRNIYFVRARERVESSGAVLPWTEPLMVYTPQYAAQATTPAAVMVQPAIIVTPDPVRWHGGSILNQAGYPYDNLNTDSPNEQLWITGYNPPNFMFDTSGSPIDTIALLATNLPAGATWYVSAYANATDQANSANATYTSSTVQFHASPNLPGRPSYHGLMRLPAARTERFWRIHLGGAYGYPPAAQNVFTYGVVGLALTAKNIAADKIEVPLDFGSLDRLRDGTPDRRSGLRGRRVEFEIALMTEAQWETQFSVLRNRVGLIDPVLVVPNTRSGAFLHDRILFGPMVAMRAQQPFTPRFTQQFTIESLI